MAAPPMMLDKTDAEPRLNTLPSGGNNPPLAVEVLMSDPTCDLLTGLSMIARFFGYTQEAARSAIDRGDILTFRKPGRRALFALKSANNARWRDLAAKHQKD